MHIQHHQLRTYRKRSRLTQADVAFIMSLSDYSNVSRWEKGNRKPSMEALIVYNSLFGLPMDSLFDQHKDVLAGDIGERIRLRIEELKALEPDQKVNCRISFLGEALARLTASKV